MKQHEMVFGADSAVRPSLVFETRYSRKRLDRTIEDAGAITQDGEVYYIVNPGFGVNAVTPNCNGCPANPKATRNYDGIELRLTNSNLVRTGGISPNKCGATGTNCTAIESSQAGFDYAAMMTKGYDYTAASNTAGVTLNSRYGQAYGWQNRRYMRFTVVFTF